MDEERQPNRDGASLVPPGREAPPPAADDVSNTTLKPPTSKLRIVTHSADNPTPTSPRLAKASTNIAWGDPIGLHIRDPKDEPLVIFRRAVGINSDLAPPESKKGRAEAAKATPQTANGSSFNGGSSGGKGGTGAGKDAASAMEEGRRQPTGIYKDAIDRHRDLRRRDLIVSWLVNLLHFVQVVLGATLTALGPDAASHSVAITALGALNTVVAGALALVKGQGVPNKLHNDAVVYRKLRDWIEETEALLAMGIIGRDNSEVGVLVESAYRKYESAQKSVENNRPDNYVPDPGSTARTKRVSDIRTDGESSVGSEK